MVVLLFFYSKAHLVSKIHFFLTTKLRDWAFKPTGINTYYWATASKMAHFLVYVQMAKTQIGLGNSPVWSTSLLFAIYYYTDYVYQSMTLIGLTLLIGLIKFLLTVAGVSLVSHHMACLSSCLQAESWLTGDSPILVPCCQEVLRTNKISWNMDAFIVP